MHAAPATALLSSALTSVSSASAPPPDAGMGFQRALQAVDLAFAETATNNVQQAPALATPNFVERDDSNALRSTKLTANALAGPRAIGSALTDAKNHIATTPEAEIVAGMSDTTTSPAPPPPLVNDAGPDLLTMQANPSIVALAPVLSPASKADPKSKVPEVPEARLKGSSPIRPDRRTTSTNAPSCLSVATSAGAYDTTLPGSSVTGLGSPAMASAEQLPSGPAVALSTVNPAPAPSAVNLALTPSPATPALAPSPVNPALAPSTVNLADLLTQPPAGPPTKHPDPLAPRQPSEGDRTSIALAATPVTLPERLDSPSSAKAFKAPSATGNTVPAAAPPNGHIRSLSNSNEAWARPWGYASTKPIQSGEAYRLPERFDPVSSIHAASLTAAAAPGSAYPAAPLGDALPYVNSPPPAGSTSVTAPSISSRSAEPVVTLSAANTSGPGLPGQGSEHVSSAEPAPFLLGPDSGSALTNPLATAPDPISGADSPAATPMLPTSNTGATSSPARQLASTLITMSHAQDGVQHMTLRLNPEDLGVVQVQIARSATGPTQVTITAERPDTLQTLREDQSDLHRTLDRAGVAAEGYSISFHVGTQDTAAPPNASGGNTGSGGDTGGFATAGGQAQFGGAPTNGGGTGQSAREHGGYPGGQRPATGSNQSNQDDKTASPRWRRVGLDITA